MNTLQSRPSTGHGYTAKCEVRDARVRPAAGADESPALRLFQHALAITHGLEPNSGLRASVLDWKHVALWSWSGQAPSDFQIPG